MKQSRLTIIRRFSRLGLPVIIAGLAGCATPRPAAVVPPPPPASPAVVQAPPPVQIAPVQPAPSQPAPVQTAPQTRRLTDENIAAIMLDANNAEIREAQLALSISRNPRVRVFAQRMIADHSHLNSAMRQLDVHLQIRPVESPASQHLRVSEQRARARLMTLRGPAFNRAYINHQVATHRTVLNGMNRILIPNARRPQLRAALLRARPVIATHLQHASQLQSILR